MKTSLIVIACVSFVGAGCNCGAPAETLDGGSGGGQAGGGGAGGGQAGGSAGGGAGGGVAGGSGGTGGSGGGTAGGAAGGTAGGAAGGMTSGLPTLYLRADALDAGELELFRQEVVDGGATGFVRLSEAITAVGGDVGTVVELSPDRTKLAYLADSTVDTQNEVFVVDLNARPFTVRKVNRPYAAMGASAISLQWSPDSRKLAYRADGEVDGVFEVYVVDVSGAMVTGGRASPGTGTATGTEETYAWSSDSRYLAVRVNGMANQVDAYVVDTSVAPPFNAVLASTNRVAVGSSVDILTGWLPGSSTLLFVGDLLTLNRGELFAVTVNGATVGTPSSVVGVPATSDVSSNFTLGLGNDFSPDKSKLAIRLLDAAGDSLLVASTAGGMLSSPVQVVPAGDVNGYAWSPDSRRLLLNLTVGADRLQLVDVSGATPGAAQPIAATGLSGTNPEGHWGFTPGGGRVFFRNASIGVRELFVADVSGAAPGMPYKVSGTVTATGTTVGVAQWAFSPDATRVAFASEQTQDGVVEAFWADAAVAATPVPLHGAPVTGGNVLDLAFSRDSRLVFFRGDLVMDQQFRLYGFDVVSGTASQPFDLTPVLPMGATGVVSYLAD